MSGKQPWQATGEAASQSWPEGRFHHLPVVVADRQVFVERDEYGRVRKCFSKGVERFQTDAENMMEMHDMGPQIAREAQQVPADRLRYRRWTKRNGRSRPRGTATRLSARRRLISADAACRGTGWPTRAR